METIRQGNVAMQLNSQGCFLRYLTVQSKVPNKVLEEAFYSEGHSIWQSISSAQAEDCCTSNLLSRQLSLLEHRSQTSLFAIKLSFSVSLLYTPYKNPHVHVIKTTKNVKQKASRDMMRKHRQLLPYSCQSKASFSTIN